MDPNALRARLLASIGLLVASTFAVFALLAAAPGGPTAVYGLNHELEFDGPFYVQYFAWLFRVLRGDLGWSPSNAEPVSQSIAERLPATIELAFFAFIAAVVIGALAGFIRARVRAPILRDVLAVPPLVCRALPVVVLALFLQLLLISTTPLPVAGMSSGDAFDVRDRLAHLVAPTLTLAVPFGAWSSLIFYDFFRASGNAVRLSADTIVGPVALAAASIGPALLSATLIVEPIFAWPGLARLFYNSLSQFDVGLVAGILLTYSVGVVLIKLCAEFSPGIAERRFPSRGKSLSAIGIIAFVALLGAAFGAVTANWLAPVGPYFIDQDHWLGYPLAPGVAGHALGTDENGRDLLSRLLIGLRISLGIAAVAAVVATALGAVVARAMKAVPLFAGRGALNTIGIRPFAAFPFILAAVMVLVARFHTVAVLSPLAIALIIAAVSWPAIVPAFRARTPAALGAVVDLTACALLLEVTLSIFGFGVQAPTPSLGNLLMLAQMDLTIAPWVAIIPGIAVVVTLFALYALGDELRERG